MVIAEGAMIDRTSLRLSALLHTSARSTASDLPQKPIILYDSPPRAELLALQHSEAGPNLRGSGEIPLALVAFEGLT
jgi:hypothetical protein